MLFLLNYVEFIFMLEIMIDLIVIFCALISLYYIVSNYWLVVIFVFGVNKVSF